MKLKTGQKYDISTLHCIGWTDNSAPDGQCEFGATEGYDWQSYFRDDVYLGQDKFAIEPLFSSRVISHTTEPRNEQLHRHRDPSVINPSTPHESQHLVNRKTKYQ